MPALLAISAGLGAYYLYTAAAFGWRGVRIGPPTTARRAPLDYWLTRLGLDGPDRRDLLVVSSVVGLAGAGLGGLLFAGPLPALALGAFGASFPLTSARRRRAARRSAGREAWPRLLEEMRILTGSVGRSIPQALFEAARHAPEELRPAFATAAREWQLSTDFARTLAVLKAELADPTADIVCETLLVAHDLGGGGLDRQLEALAEDRRADQQGRKDARARQAGARFARSFVLVVPLGMALVGLSIGNGRDAYQTPAGQVAVLVAVLLLVGCWIWAGRLMRLPDEERIFAS